MKKSLIYMASPASHPDPKVRAERVRRAAEAAGHLMLYNNVVVFSPLTHSDQIEDEMERIGYASKSNWAFWGEVDHTILLRCDELWVLEIDGWATSVGVTAEIKWAEEKWMKISYITDEELVSAIADRRPMVLESEP